MSDKQTRCPNCGYCPHCGQSYSPWNQWQPWQQYKPYPYYPFWGQMQYTAFPVNSTVALPSTVYQVKV